MFNGWRELIKDMIKRLLPNLYIKSVYDIDFKEVYRLGYEGLIFDIDSTLVPHGSEVTDEVNELFKQLHDIGFKTVFLSNNSVERILEFNKEIKTDFIGMANKPHPKNFFRALDKLGVEKSKVLLIGDQIFTDILGANKCNIDNVLVKYLLHEGEMKIGKKRKVEQVILAVFELTKRWNKNNARICK
ncbi:YqeG family HAD IIIA-type phosphatase, partial [Staphylococcus aureus]